MKKRLNILYLAIVTVFCFIPFTCAFDKVGCIPDSCACFADLNGNLKENTPIDITAEADIQPFIPLALQSEIDGILQSANGGIPERRAWIVDLDGNITEIIPLSFGVSAGDNNVTEVQFLYKFYGYTPHYVTIDWEYALAGENKQSNNTHSNIESKYTQNYTASTEWSVSTSISGNDEVSRDFLSKLEAQAGGSINTSATTPVGWSYFARYIVRPDDTVILTNYHVGISSGGVIIYSIYYASGGAYVGFYCETAGGTAPDSTRTYVIALMG